MKSDQEEIVAASKRIIPIKGSSRAHRIDFVSPLLDYGYPPAVEELANRQKKRQRLASNSSQANNILDDNEEKPILLYLPGFDGTYIWYVPSKYIVLTIVCVCVCVCVCVLHVLRLITTSSLDSPFIQFPEVSLIL